MSYHQQYVPVWDSVDTLRVSHLQPNSVRQCSTLLSKLVLGKWSMTVRSCPQLRQVIATKVLLAIPILCLAQEVFPTDHKSQLKQVRCSQRQYAVAQEIADDDPFPHTTRYTVYLDHHYASVSKVIVHMHGILVIAVKYDCKNVGHCKVKQPTCLPLHGLVLGCSLVRTCPV